MATSRPPFLHSEPYRLAPLAATHLFPLRSTFLPSRMDLSPTRLADPPRARTHHRLSSPSREAPPTRRRQPLSFLSVGSDPTRFKLDPPWHLGRSPPLLKLVLAANSPPRARPPDPKPHLELLPTRFEPDPTRNRI